MPPGRHQPAVLGDDGQAHTRLGPPDAHLRVLVRVAEPGAASDPRLGARVAHGQRRADARPGLADQRGGGRSPAHDDGPYRREVGGVEGRVTQHQGDLGRHAAEGRDLKLGHHAQRVGRPPRSLREVLGAALLEVAGQLRRRAKVRQRGAGHGMAAATPLSPTSHWVMKAIWRPQKTAPFGVPVVPDVKTMAIGRSASLSSGRGRAPGRRRPSSTPPGGRRLHEDGGEPPVRVGRRQLLRGDDDEGLAAREHRGAFGLHQLGVHRRGHGAELGRGDVGDEVLGNRGEQQADDVTLPHAQLGQAHRRLVGHGVELLVAEGQPFVGDEGRRRPEALGRFGRGLGQHASRSLTPGAGRGRARPRCCAGSPTSRRRSCRRRNAGTALPRRRRRTRSWRSTPRGRARGGSGPTGQSVRPGPVEVEALEPQGLGRQRSARCSASLLKSFRTRCSGGISPRVALAKPR